MTVLITLTTAGPDSGPFDLYSNLDAFAVPFETGVTRAALLAGYSSVVVPNFATIIKIKSTGVCINSVEVPVAYPTTTTTTTTIPQTTTTTTTVAPGLGKMRSITIGAYSCISGICSLVGNTVIQIYTLSQGTYIQEGEIVYTDVNLTIPYLGSSSFKAPHSVGYTGVFSINQTTGEIELICMLGDGC